MAMSMDVILPRNTTRQIGLQGKAGEGKVPTLYLLHGCSDDHTIWLRRTSIERYVAPLGLAVVMPNVHRSYYTNMKEGFDYWDYVSEHDPLRMVDDLCASGKPKPKLFQCCGIEDLLYQANLRFKTELSHV